MFLDGPRLADLDDREVYLAHFVGLEHELHEIFDSAGWLQIMVEFVAVLFLLFLGDQVPLSL